MSESTKSDLDRKVFVQLELVNWDAPDDDPIRVETCCVQRKCK
jgi:hypothetical protein